MEPMDTTKAYARLSRIRGELLDVISVLEHERRGARPWSAVDEPETMDALLLASNRIGQVISSFERPELATGPLAGPGWRWGGGRLS